MVFYRGCYSSYPNLLKLKSCVSRVIGSTSDDDTLTAVSLCNRHRIANCLASQPHIDTDRRPKKVACKLIEAIMFDCDGVLAETERDGHRVAFNEAFEQMNISANWGVNLYGELLQIAGGKERITHYFNSVGWPVYSIDRDKLIQQIHATKTKIFEEKVSQQKISARPGVNRIMKEALSKDIKLGICSTSNEKAVRAIAKAVLHDDINNIANIKFFAGDVVSAKKPSPEIYLLAAASLNVIPANCCVIEDSTVGLQAAKSAGMKCIITKSVYTISEKFDLADLVVDDLDNGPNGIVTLETLQKLLT